MNQRFKREEPQTPPPQTPTSTPPASATESVSVGTTKTGKFLICEEKGGGGERERKKESIVLTMIGISNSHKTCYQVGCQSRTNACI